MKDIPDFLNKAAENSVSTFIMETDNMNNNEKIIEFSSIANDFIEKLHNTIENIKKNKLVDVAKEMNHIYQSKEIDNKIKSELSIILKDYPDYYKTSAIYSFTENLKNLENLKEIDDVHIKLIEHLSNMISIQIILNNQP